MATGRTRTPRSARWWNAGRTSSAGQITVKKRTDFFLPCRMGIFCDITYSYYNFSFAFLSKNILEVLNEKRNILPKIPFKMLFSTNEFIVHKEDDKVIAKPVRKLDIQSYKKIIKDCLKRFLSQVTSHFCLCVSYLNKVSSSF